MENEQCYGEIRRTPLKSSTMPALCSRSTTKLEEGSNCQCCPYGYHIDVGFVQYCETLYKSSYLDQLEQMKKNKKKPRKSVEAHLQEFKTVYNKTDMENFQMVMYPVSTGSQQIAYTLEALNSATSQSPVTSPGGSIIPKPVLENIRQQMATSLERMRELEEKVKNLAVLQVQLSVLKEEKRLLILQIKAKENKAEKAPTKLEVKPVKQRSKSDGEEELEEGSSMRFHGPSKFSSYFKRKTFVRPSLAADNSQSRLESCEEDLSSPGLTASLSASISRKKQLDNSDMQQKYFSDHEVLSNESRDVNRVNNMKITATHKLLPTQDIGIGYVPEKVHAIGVGDSNVHIASQYVCIKCGQQEGKWSSSGCSFFSESSEGELEVKKENKYTSTPQILSGVQCQELLNKTFETQSTNTDGHTNNQQLKVDQIRFDTQEHISIVPQPECCTNCKGKLHQKFQNIAVGDCVPVSDISSKFKSSLMVTCGMNTEVTTQQESGTCTELKMTDVLSQQELISRRHPVTSCGYSTMISVGLQVSPQVVETKDAALQTTNTDVQHICVQADTVNYKNTTERGVGTGRVNHVVCERCCNVETRSIGIGSYSISDETCQHCFRFQVENKDVVTDCQLETSCMKCRETDTRTVGCGDFSVSEVCWDYCKTYQTETVGVGDEDVGCVLCDHCVNLKVDGKTLGEDFIQRRSIGINTSFETGLLDLLEPSSLNSVGIRLCDKCNTTIYSVATRDTTGKNTLPTSVSRHRVHSSQIPILKRSVNVDSESVVSELCPQSIEETNTTEQHSMIKVQKEASFDSSSFQNPHARLAVDETSFLKQDSLQKENNTKSFSCSNKSRLKAVKLSCGSESDTTESSGSESSSSPEEGSYDGNIINCCVDELAIKLKKPGAEMFEAVHHAKTELTKEMKAACKVLNDYLVKPGNKDEKKMKSCFAVIQQEWFKVTSQKNADPHVVEDHLDALEEFSNQLLSHVVNLTDNNGNTAMHYAVSHGNFDVVSVLLDSKVCDVTKHNKAGYNCMMLVSLTDVKNDAHHDVIQRLFHLGDINSKATQNGQTALMLAVSQKNVKMVEMLLEAGAEINLQDDDGSTALMCAAEHGHKELVKLLLSHPDCDLYLTDRDGSTALTICMEAGHRDLGLLIYASMNFSRGSSPYSSLRRRRQGYASNRSTPTPRTPPPPSPAHSRKSSSSVP
ncbi:KN motif and ankyrin repeat domain-containing protein 1 isoform X1 [Limulus polyphemus]|uniref:KN motif and ankyrin repeat domain-containing protein 1 isoform X1 n=1 Tax=Limulus polyphemus TaxID=6850 RepID=A0ABM1TM25_LIMPO|nr:KN motif and ankyrin repeat domain-containing protein 1 isoform X1 [Limulus polyphemus]